MLIFFINKISYNIIFYRYEIGEYLMTLLLHLSDIHIGDSSTVDINGIVSELPSGIAVENCFIIFTGDFSQQHLDEEISAFDVLINNIKGLIDRKYGVDCQLILVPGNHDISIDESKQEQYRSITNMKSGDVKKLYVETLKNQKQSINYCKKYGIDFSKNSIVYKTFDTNKTRFHFVLVNSAPFSMLGSNDKDKGIHYLLPNNYPIHGDPQKGKTTIEILVSHHRPDWFVYSAKTALEDFENTVATFGFYGHEHTCEIKEVRIDYEEGSTIISKGGELNVNSGAITGSLAAYYVNDDCSRCEMFKFVFDYKKNKFKRHHFEKENLKTNTPLLIKDTFISTIINPLLKDDVRERDIFVMPLLKASGKQENINDFQSFVDHIGKQHKVYLFGNPNCGKSILLHRLFEYFKNDKWCIYLDVKYEYPNNIETAIKNAFNEEYRSAINVYDDFIESPLDEKIILIDNFDCVEKDYKKNEILDYLKEKFGIIIVSSIQKNESLSNLIKRYFEENETFIIGGFSIKQRIEFYNKYLKQKNIISENELSLITNAIEASISTCSVLDISDPSYLLPLISQIYNNKLYQERDTQNAFTIIFEHSLRSAILNASNGESLDDCISVIQLLALHTVFVKQGSSFDFADISKCVKERRKDFTHIKLTDEDVLRILVGSKLVYKEDNEYRFERNSFLAYFASLEIIRLYQSGKTDYFNKIVDNIVYGINGDIFVFVVYQLKTINVFFDIHDTLDKLLSKFEEINFETKNNPILKLNKKLIPETKRQAENKKALYERLDTENRRRIESARDNERKAFDVEEDKEINAINKIAKLIEISCKVIAGFPSEIDSETRYLFLDKTISASLKIVNLLFSFSSEEEIKEVEEDFNNAKKQWIDNAKENGINERIIKQVEDMDIVHAFYDMLITFVLNIETTMSNIISSRVSLPIINKLEDDVFFKKLFKIITYAETGNFDAFCSQIKYFYKEPEKNKEKLLIINRVVRVFAIKNGLNSEQCANISKITGIPQLKLLEFCSSPKKKD